jgi:type I restriction enzyme R subunit
MLYRLLATKSFRRICFVVDRSALGNQAAGEFESTKIVSGKAFADIFGLKKLEDVTPESELPEAAFTGFFFAAPRLSVSAE